MSEGGKEVILLFVRCASCTQAKATSPSTKEVMKSEVSVLLFCKFCCRTMNWDDFYFQRWRFYPVLVLKLNGKPHTGGQRLYVKS